jgi:hypothetical protein
LSSALADGKMAGESHEGAVQAILCLDRHVFNFRQKEEKSFSLISSKEIFFSADICHLFCFHPIINYRDGCNVLVRTSTIDLEPKKEKKQSNTWLVEFPRDFPLSTKTIAIRVSPSG